MTTWPWHVPGARVTVGNMNPARRLWAVLLVTCVLLLVSPAKARAATSPWTWPLDPRPAVEQVFVRPAAAWTAGHRGVDLMPRGSAATGDPVRAVADGVVSHMGVIAGVPTISVTHPSGLRSTYQPVEAVVGEGDEVARGDLIGHLRAEGSHCAPRICLHLGAIRGSTYVDPLLLLRPVRIILLPLDP